MTTEPITVKRAVESVLEGTEIQHTIEEAPNESMLIATVNREQLIKWIYDPTTLLAVAPQKFIEMGYPLSIHPLDRERPLYVFANDPRST